MQTPLLTPSDIRHRIWMELQRATQDRHHEWRTPVLATVGTDDLPQARTVVLRHADISQWKLHIYTDRRSPKVAELTANPALMLTFWSKRLGWQLRAQATASVQSTGPDVDAVWAKVSQSPAAADYLSATAPGQALGEPIAAQAAAATHSTSSTPSEKAPAHHLAIITAQVQSIDWLELARTGHRRAVLLPGSWSWRVP